MATILKIEFSSWKKYLFCHQVKKWISDEKATIAAKWDPLSLMGLLAQRDPQKLRFSNKNEVSCLVGVSKSELNWKDCQVSHTFENWHNDSGTSSSYFFEGKNWLLCTFEKKGNDSRFHKKGKLIFFSFFPPLQNVFCTVYIFWKWLENSWAIGEWEKNLKETPFAWLIRSTSI